MSRLPLLSLDDILGDSPTKNAFDDINLPDTTNSEQGESPSKTIPHNNASKDSKPGPDQPHPDDPEALLNALLEENQERLRLKKLRDSLLIKRSELKSDVEEINIRVNYLRSKKQPPAKKKVKKTIRKRTVDATPATSQTQISMIPSSNFNFLPSDDWKDRLAMVRHFAPFLDVRQQQSLTNNDGTRTLIFTLISPNLFKVPFKLNLTSLNSVSSMQITSKSALMTLSLLSPTIHQKIEHDFLVLCKLNILMHCLSSLSGILQKRIQTVYEIIRKFSKFITHSRFKPLMDSHEIDSDVRLYAIVRTVESVELNVPVENTIYTIRLVWNIILSDYTTGACGSDLKLIATNNSTAMDLSSLFSALAAEHGVVAALETIIKTSFHVMI